jgi:hypothetical protein
MALLDKVCHGRLHDILSKEYSGKFPELLIGTIKEVSEQSDVVTIIVTRHTNI